MPSWSQWPSQDDLKPPTGRVGLGERDGRQWMNIRPARDPAEETLSRGRMHAQT